MSEKNFDASRYLVSLRGKEYLEVKWRLLWLRTEHPDATIETELVTFTPEVAVFKAKVSLPGGGSATGWGQEEPRDFGDYLEKSETKALGRALAALGYGTQFTEDFEFKSAEGEQRVVDSPAERPVERERAVRPAPTNGPGGYQNGTNGHTTTGARRAADRPSLASVSGGVALAGRPETRPALPATEPQVKAIYAIGRGAQSMDEKEVEAKCRELFGVTPSELSRRQASEFIDALKAGGN